MQSRWRLLAESAKRSTMDIFHNFALAFKYLKYHLISSYKLSKFASIAIWFVLKYINQLTRILSDSTLTLIRSIFSFSERVTYLVTFIALVCLWKSLEPKYRLLEPKPPRGARNRQRSCARVAPKTVHLDESRPVKLRLIKDLETLYVDTQQECRGSVTVGDMNEIHRQLSWSQSRIEFENVHWFNRSTQILWPTAKTLVSKILADVSKHQDRPARGRRELISAKHAAKEPVKLAVYLSCRRQLDLIRKARDGMLRKGDEYIGQKFIILTIYLVKKVIVCFKQCLIDHLRHLMSSVMPDGDGAASISRPCTRKRIDLDLKEMLKRQNIEVDLKHAQPKNKPKSAGKQREPKPFRGGCRSAKSGSPINPRRTISQGLISEASMRKCRKLRQQLVRRLNSAYATMKSTREAGVEKRLLLKHLNLGNSAPKLTAIKYLDQEDGTNMLARVMRDTPYMETSSPQLMQLLLELDFTSDQDFRLLLGSVPVLDEIELSRVHFRARILATASHETFGDLKRNLDILAAPNDGTLLPILNYIQLTLVDVPQLDWHVGKLDRAGAQTPGRKLRLKGARKAPTNVAMWPMNGLRKSLQPINLVNHSYFKYLVHLMIGSVQRWFQPFDILVGARLRLRTLV